MHVSRQPGWASTACGCRLLSVAAVLACIMQVSAAMRRFYCNCCVTEPSSAACAMLCRPSKQGGAEHW